MFARICAITGILLCTSLAWAVLSETIRNRTGEYSSKLRPGVASIWGSPQEQGPPAASSGPADLPLDSSRIQVALALDHRRKGLLWYSTYVVDFAGTYTFRNISDESRTVVFRVKLPAEHAIYDGLVMEVNGSSLPVVSDQKCAIVSAPIDAKTPAVLRVAYRSQGMDSWRYRLGAELGQVRDFNSMPKPISAASISRRMVSRPLRNARAPRDGTSPGATPT